jgi:hypothetical protein
LAIGEKLFEEKGKVTMVSVESADAMGVILKRSSNSEAIGSGRFPSGTNMGYGTLSVHHDGKSHGDWVGIIVTEDKMRRSCGRDLEIQRRMARDGRAYWS